MAPGDQTPRPGPAPGMGCAGLEGARATRGLGTLPGHPRALGRPPSRLRSCPSSRPGPRPTRFETVTIPVSRPLPAASRNGHGAAGASRSVAPCPFARRQAGIPSCYTDPEAETSRFCKTGCGPRPSPPRPRDPGSPRARACPPGHSGCPALPRPRKPVGRRQGPGRARAAVGGRGGLGRLLPVAWRLQGRASVEFCKSRSRSSAERCLCPAQRLLGDTSLTLGTRGAVSGRASRSALRVT